MVAFCFALFVFFCSLLREGLEAYIPADALLFSSLAHIYFSTFSIFKISEVVSILVPVDFPISQLLKLMFYKIFHLGFSRIPN